METQYKPQDLSQPAELHPHGTILVMPNGAKYECTPDGWKLIQTPPK